MGTSFRLCSSRPSARSSSRSRVRTSGRAQQHHHLRRARGSRDQKVRGLLQCISWFQDCCPVIEDRKFVMAHRFTEAALQQRTLCGGICKCEFAPQHASQTCTSPSHAEPARRDTTHQRILSPTSNPPPPAPSKAKWTCCPSRSRRARTRWRTELIFQMGGGSGLPDEMAAIFDCTRLIHRPPPPPPPSTLPGLSITLRQHTSL